MKFIDLPEDEQLEAIKLYSHEELAGLTKHSQRGKVLTATYDRLYADIRIVDQDYRFDSHMMRIKERSGPQSWKTWRKYEDRKAMDHDWLELCIQADEPELLPATQDAAPNVTCVSHLKGGSLLKMLAVEINHTYESYQDVEREAATLMLKIGLMLEKAKMELPHGQLIKWCSSNLSITYRHATRFRKLAQVFIKTQQIKPDEAFLLVNPENSQAAIADKLQQMAFEFLGDKTQAELFAEYGISVKKAAKELGNNPPPPNPQHQLPEGETVIHYDAVIRCGKALEPLKKYFIDKDSREIQHLRRGELESFADYLQTSLNNVRDLIKAG